MAPFPALQNGENNEQASSSYVKEVEPEKGEGLWEEGIKHKVEEHLALTVELKCLSAHT